LQEIPPGLATRYLIVGAWNTLFGYGLYALLTYWLTPLIPAAYMVAATVGTVIAITVSFLGHKFFVFRTKGNLGKEYVRSWMVYGTTNLIGLILLPVLVFALNPFVTPQAYVPYIAGALLTGGTIVVAFFGHKKFTFAHRQVPQGEPKAAK
jgi:putative flippase GtrA